jgi:hypothetical protein
MASGKQHPYGSSQPILWATPFRSPLTRRHFLAFPVASERPRCLRPARRPLHRRDDVVTSGYSPANVAQDADYVALKNGRTAFNSVSHSGLKG